MSVQVLPQDDQYMLNFCAKYLARADLDQFTSDNWSDDIHESWRFPIIDSYSDGVHFEENYTLNRVTFIYAQQGQPRTQNIAVIGTFNNLYEPLPLKQVKFLDTATRYYALTVVVPKGEAHTYKFIVDGDDRLDAVNPQRITLDNGQVWSRFFTQLCTEPLSLSRTQFALLSRLTEHILPFRTDEGQQFLSWYYNKLDTYSKQTQYAYAYRLDQPVGVANYIDNLLTREERHHLVDYTVCLRLIDNLLRTRDPHYEPFAVNREMYAALYDEMSSNKVDGWDYEQYSNPRYFLQLLRRHTFTGAFSHPKYGGNAGAAGWSYLEEKYKDANGQTLFNWRRTIEKPLGNNSDYHG